MEMKVFVSPVLDENIYVLSNDKGECAVVDPGNSNMKDVIEYIEENKLVLTDILLTHGHFDHIMGVQKLLEYKEVRVNIGSPDIPFLYDHNLSLSGWVEVEYKIDEKYDINGIKDGDIVFGMKAISTPGHTAGSTCYLDEEGKRIFTGDTLFRRAYGRTDFPTGNARDLRDSLSKLFKLSEDIVVYPGHGLKSTIGEEKNAYYGMFF